MLTKEQLLQILTEEKPRLIQLYNLCALGVCDLPDDEIKEGTEITILFEFSKLGMGSTMKEIHNILEKRIGRKVNLVRESAWTSEKKLLMLNKAIWV